jgi:hypothetical protein
MNSCILITSHLNTPKKIKAAEEALHNLKEKTDLPIIFMGNYPIPVSIQHLVNYSLYTDDNRKAKSPRYLNYKGKRIWDYGYPHLVQMLNGMIFIKVLGFEYVHHFNYDVILEEGEYEKLVEKGKDGEFLYYAWGNDGISTCIFSIKPDMFIDVIGKYLHYYDTGNPPGIRPDWFAEIFLEWAFLKEYPSLNNYCDIKYKLISDNW